MANIDKPRSERNRTLMLTEEETSRYIRRCLSPRDLDDTPSFTDRVVWGDTLSAAARLPCGFADLLIVDPPYNLGKTYGTSRFQPMKDEEYAAFTEQWVAAFKPALKPTASLYVCCDWKSSLIIGPLLKRHFHLQNRITWQREKGRGALHNWKNSMEDIWFATVLPKNYAFFPERVKLRRKVIAPYRSGGQPKDWVESEDGNFRDTFPSNFWDDLSIPYWSMRENTEHPAQKPEKLLAKLILASSNPGDVVLDPFLGSGTTAVVAKKLGRHFFGVESDRSYCALAQKRLELAAADPSIQGYCDGVFWERNTLGEQQKARKKKKPQALEKENKQKNNS